MKFLATKTVDDWRQQLIYDRADEFQAQYRDFGTTAQYDRFGDLEDHFVPGLAEREFARMLDAEGLVLHTAILPRERPAWQTFILRRMGVL